MQACNVVEKANNFARTVANEWPELDDYQLNAYKRLTEEMQMLESMLEHIKSRRKAA
jgi:phage-related protein